MVLRQLAEASDAAPDVSINAGAADQGPSPFGLRSSACSSGCGLSLASLPDEIVLAILACCDAPSLTVLSVCSRELSVLANAEVLWHELVLRRYW